MYKQIPHSNTKKYKVGDIHKLEVRILRKSYIEIQRKKATLST